MLHSGHPSIERLADLAGGRLSARARSILEQHVAQCRGCSGELDRLTTTIAEMRSAAVARLLERFTAALRFDSRATPLAFGVRGTSQSATRQLVFAAGPFELDLRTGPTSDGWIVAGQVLGPTDATFGDVRLLRAGAEAAETPLSELLEFNLPPVASGVYRLEVQLGTILIDVDDLEVGP